MQSFENTGLVECFDFFPEQKENEDIKNDIIQWTERFITPHFANNAPTISPVFKTYWEFAFKRHQIYLERLKDAFATSEDKIIASYKFTNVYRVLDKTSQYLVENVIYSGKWSSEDLFFRIILFKLFNKIETWQALEKEFGEISWKNYDFNKYNKVFTEIMEKGEPIYSAAYIMASGKEVFNYERKHQNHLKIIEMMMDDKLPKKLEGEDSLEKVFRTLLPYPCMGNFIAYQLAIDLNYSELVNCDENEFIVPGPGALSGIKKVFPSLGSLNQAEIIEFMTEIQEEAFIYFTGSFPYIHNRKMKLIDMQNVFCEVDKYSRVHHPRIEGIGDRNRIKQGYKPTTASFKEPFFPPKWKAQLI